MPSILLRNTFRGWTGNQHRTFFAGVSGRTLDAFDSFLVVFVLSAVSTTFHASIVTTSLAITLTLVMRPVGAAIIGGITAGTLSQRFGRKRIIFIFALLALPCLPLWAFASGSWTLGLGAALMQFMVQGAWGVIAVLILFGRETRDVRLAGAGREAGRVQGSA